MCSYINESYEGRFVVRAVKVIHHMKAVNVNNMVETMAIYIQAMSASKCAS